jgi:hypothetical protein
VLGATPLVHVTPPGVDGLTLIEIGAIVAGQHDGKGRGLL